MDSTTCTTWTTSTTFGTTTYNLINIQQQQRQHVSNSQHIN